MSELAEGARLEIVCAAKSGTEGSNPSLSAIINKCLKCLKLEMPKLKVSCLLKGESLTFAVGLFGNDNRPVYAPPIFLALKTASPLHAAKF